MKDDCFACKTNVTVLQSPPPVKKFLSVFCCHDELNCHKVMRLVDFSAIITKVNYCAYSSFTVAIFLAFWSRF